MVKVAKTGVKDKLTILIDKEIKERYKEYCNLNGLVIGKQIELLISKELDIKKEEENEKNK